MSAVLMQLLQPQVVLRVISRLREGQGFFGRFFGFQPDRFDPDTVTLAGPNTLTTGNTLRQVSYRTFDATRVPAKFRAPGTGPATVTQNPMGQAQISIARFHQKIPLEGEFLGNLSQMVGPNSVIDSGGQDYILRQETFMARQFNIMVDMMAAGMCRDSLYFSIVGDDWFPTFTAPTMGLQIPFLIPSTNKGQLDQAMGTDSTAGPIITIPRDNSGAPILDNVLSIIAAYVQLTGYAMTDVIINSLMWGKLLKNTQLRNTAGSSNTVFAEWDRVPETFMDGEPSVYYACKLKALPMVTWHICDDVVALNTNVDPINSSAPAGATLAKMVPDNMAIFTTRPSSMWTQMIHGGELVSEQPGMPMVYRGGYYAWKEWVTQPTAVELLSLLNAIPALYVPKAIAPAVVSGF